LVPGATYNWRVKGPKFLSNSGAVTLVGSFQTNQEMGLMRTGDVNNDNCVTVSDFNLLRNTLGKSQGDSGYDPRADFNGDNTVTIADFNLLRPNLGSCGSNPIGPVP
jgi:large repetitive protein